jgi:hypothetical protein
MQNTVRSWLLRGTATYRITYAHTATRGRLRSSSSTTSVRGDCALIRREGDAAPTQLHERCGRGDEEVALQLPLWLCTRPTPHTPRPAPKWRRPSTIESPSWRSDAVQRGGTAQGTGQRKHSGPGQLESKVSHTCDVSLCCDLCVTALIHTSVTSPSEQPHVPHTLSAAIQPL